MSPFFILGFLGVTSIALFSMNDSVAASHETLRGIDDVNEDDSSILDSIAESINDRWMSPVHENYGVEMMARFKTSDGGIDQLKIFEGFSAKAYWDHKGYSIGFGHLIRPGDGLSKDSIITREQAERFLIEDVTEAEDTINNSIHVAINQNQFDAMVSLCYNIGVSAFKKSTLVKRVNNGDHLAYTEFHRWNRASGKVNPVLVDRRAVEADIFIA